MSEPRADALPADGDPSERLKHMTFWTAEATTEEIVAHLLAEQAANDADQTED